MTSSLPSLLPYLGSVFATVFIAELGDKTQLATVLFAAEGRAGPWLIFAATALALVCAAGFGVLLGSFAGKYLDALPLKLIAGLGFIAIGAWTLWGHFSAGGSA